MHASIFAAVVICGAPTPIQTRELPLQAACGQRATSADAGAATAATVATAGAVARAACACGGVRA
eukprot:2028401-Prymnesium_polylepis.1